MNKIQAEIKKTKYCNESHLVITVDTIPLDIFLVNKLNNDSLIGLIPTFLDWFWKKEEEAVIWDRLDMSKNESRILPILMCPDDLDFDCSLIVTKMTVNQNTIIWEKIGLDHTPDTYKNPSLVGTEVNWLDLELKLEFDKKDFEQCLQAFKTADNNV